VRSNIRISAAGPNLAMAPVVIPNWALVKAAREGAQGESEE